MGKKDWSCSQEPLWVAGADLPRSAGHPFYERLNGIRDAGGFDEFAESACAVFYAERMGRPSLLPDRYFRLLLLGYFEGLGSERGIAWRAQDSLSCWQRSESEPPTVWKVSHLGRVECTRVFSRRSP